MLLALHTGALPGPSRDWSALVPSASTATGETDCTADGNDCASGSHNVSRFWRDYWWARDEQDDDSTRPTPAEPWEADISSSNASRFVHPVDVAELPSSKQEGSRRVAWMHFPKCGSSLAVTLARYLNSKLPEDASLEDEMLQQYVNDVQEVAFARVYPMPWGQDAIWEKDGNWGNHMEAKEETYAKFKGSFMGLFREPTRRVWSAYNFFEQGRANKSRIAPPAAYARRSAGGMVKMLAGQDYGLHCLDFKRPCDMRIQPDEELAINRLREGFAFVGMTDDYAFSVCLFKALFGGDCAAAEFGNSRPSKYSEEPDDYREAMGVDEKYDPADSRLFQAAQKRYCEDIASIGLTHGRCRETVCPAAAEHFTGKDDQGGAGC